MCRFNQHVVAGVLRDGQGRVLLAQRPSGKALAGMWEFPGGKVEAGEDPRAALVRELHEELGVHAAIGRRRPSSAFRRCAPQATSPALAGEGIRGASQFQRLQRLAAQHGEQVRAEQRIEVDGQSVSLSAAILIPGDIEKKIVRPQDKNARAGKNANGIEYWSGNLADTQLREEVERAVNGEVRQREYLLRGLDATAVREVEQTFAPIASLNPKKEVGQEAVKSVDVIKQWAPSAFVYLLWISIFAIAQMLLTNIIEEKSNRIIEVLLSSVTPGELMMGKLFGIAAVGLTMVGSWILAIVTILTWKAGAATAVAGQLLVVLHSSALIPMFGVYFVFGYLIYAASILAVGSVCNTLKEAQSYMGVITMLMMVPLMTMTFIPKDPNGPLARILSWIPLYTPFAMLAHADGA